MRYWVVRADGKGAEGPFEASDLVSRPGFGADSVVAPENAQAADAWKPAHAVPELRALMLRPPSAMTGRKAPPLPPAPSRPTAELVKSDLQPPPASPESSFGKPTSSLTDLVRLLGTGVMCLILLVIFVVTCGTPRSTTVATGPRLSIAVEGIEYTERDVANNEFVRPRPGNHWAVVQFSVRAVQGVASFFPGNIKLVDTSGNVLERNSSQLDSGLSMVQALSPAEKLAGTVLYQVPKGVRAVRFKYDDYDYGFDIPLGGPTAPGAVEAPTTSGPEQEAIDLVKNLTVRKPLIARCPRSIETIADSATSWPRVVTIQDGIMCNRFWNAAILAGMAAQRTGKTRENYAREFRRAPEDFRKWEVKVSDSWTAAHEGGGNYAVAVVVNQQGRKVGGEVNTTTTWRWRTSLATRTIKPLNLGGWLAVDLAKAGKWAASEAERDPHGPVGGPAGAAQDGVDVGTIAPEYPVEAPANPARAGPARGPGARLERRAAGGKNVNRLPGMNVPAKDRRLSSSDQGKQCPGLLKIMGSGAELAARFGAEKGAKLLDMAKARFEEHHCSDWIEAHPNEAAADAQ